MLTPCLESVVQHDTFELLAALLPCPSCQGIHVTRQHHLAAACIVCNRVAEGGMLVLLLCAVHAAAQWVLMWAQPAVRCTYGIVLGTQQLEPLDFAVCTCVLLEKPLQ